MRPRDVADIVQDYLNHQGKKELRFNNNRPGKDWIRAFLQRHKELSQRMCENVKRTRCAVTRKEMNKFFQNLQESIRGVPPQNIINFDETNFTDDPGAPKVLAKRGVKHIERIVDSSKTSTSVMIAAAADGTVLPPYTVYKAKHLYPGWCEGGIPGSGYNSNPSGWFDLRMFSDWFYKILLPYAKKLEGSKVIICDNLSSHLSIDVIRSCEKNDITFVLLPPNTTHICQPLDEAFFRPLKGAWRKVLDDWNRKNRGVLPKTMFPRMLKSAFEEVGIKIATNVISGFRACGIFPLNPSKVLEKIPDHEDLDSSQGSSWKDAFVNHLKRSRTEETRSMNQTTKRGRRLNITPGKGVLASDFQATKGNEDCADDRMYSPLGSEEEDDPHPETSVNTNEIEEAGPAKEISEQCEMEENLDHARKENYEIGEFVLVKGGLMAQAVRRLPPTAGVPSSRLGHSMWAS